MLNLEIKLKDFSSFPGTKYESCNCNQWHLGLIAPLIFRLFYKRINDINSFTYFLEKIKCYLINI